MTQKQCYIDYTRCILEKTNSVDEDKAEITFGNYEAVKVLVDDAIIDRCNAVSMRKLLSFTEMVSDRKMRGSIETNGR